MLMSKPLCVLMFWWIMLLKHHLILCLGFWIIPCYAIQQILLLMLIYYGLMMDLKFISNCLIVFAILN
jgi:hypothetical protein